MSSDDELDEIRKRRMVELRQQLLSEQAKVEQQKNVELQKQTLLRQILTPEARQRLNRLKLVKPDFVGQLELQLIQIAQSGRVKLPLGDDQLKRILIQLQPRRHKTRFRRI